MERKGLHSAGIRKKYGKYFFGDFFHSGRQKEEEKSFRKRFSLFSDADVAEK